MAKEGYLKSQNSVQIWVFISINITVFIAIILGTKVEFSSIESLWKQVNAKDGIILAGIPLLSIILNGLLSHESKARIVFWRYQNPLPGCRAFSRLIKSDPRIDVEALRKKIGNFPEKPSEQNALWYKFYRAHQDAITVVEAHKVYLLTRDLAAISLLFAILFSAGILAIHIGRSVALFYSIALIFQYVGISTAARNYGNRFVLNVLAEESHAK